MKYRISSDDVVFEDFDGEMVVLDLGTGRYFGLNASASALWAALSGGVETASLAAAGAPAGWIAGFAAEAVQAGLLVEAPDAPSIPLPLGITLIENRGGIRICRAIGSICLMEKPLEPEKPRPMQLRSRDYLSQPARHDPARISSEVYSKKNGLFHKAILTEYRA